MNREAEIQDALKNLIERIAKKSRFAGLEITHVERDYPVDNKEADIVLFMRGETPFMFIETKRKGKERVSLFDPLDVSVVGQVMSYAAIYKRSHNVVVPFVATANPDRIAVFRTPENIEDYIDREAVMKRDYKNAFKPGKYSSILENQMRGKCEKLVLSEGYIQTFLEKLAREYLERRVIKAEPTEALIERFKGFVTMIAERCKPLVESKIGKEPLETEVKKLGYKLDPKSLPSTISNLTRMMTYVLMNKIIFCKILEGSYRLPKMVSLDSSSLTRFTEQLAYYFRRAIEVTGDFEPIFSTGVYDRLPIPDDSELMEYINDFISTLDSIDLTKMGAQIGYMYEELIPPEERHQFGQFYTPPWVCEFITKWCIRGPEDVVLDPGVGSGGFLLRAYRVLQEEKVGPSVIQLVRKDIHERILGQLYALDINPFPAHLSAMGLSMKHVKVPSTKMNVMLADFFSLQPEQEVLSPYVVKTVAGEQRRKIIIPKMDTVIGNPPYTRWTEILDETQELIKQRMGKLMKKYGLTPQVSRGVEPGIYTYWIIHATNFLKPKGRLGMIISNTWLQTDYGIGFANFLLDHFRIQAIVDIALKLFKGALITTCIVLAEKESDEAKRLENEVAFIHIPGEVESADVGGLLEVVEVGRSEKYTINVVKQGDLPRDRKWIEAFFKTIDIFTHPLLTRLDKLFELSDGNAAYLFLASTGKVKGVKNVGCDGFYYLQPSKIKEYKLEKWAYPHVPINKAILYPAIVSARQSNFFTFSEEDWKEMRKSDDRCYMFVCHEPRKKLPKEVVDYVMWGETDCRTRIRGSRKGGRLASETEAAKARVKEPKRFYGWYDLGGVIPAVISTPRRAWRKSRFALCKFPVAMDDTLEALIPKKGAFSEIQIRAFLAYLNSNFAQFYIETKGIKSPGGVIGFEGIMAREMPVLDVRKLGDKQLTTLAKLYDELEHEARKIGGASSKPQIEKLKPKIYEIDRAVAALLDVKDEDLKNVEDQVDLMVERRTSAAKRAKGV